MSSPEIRFWGKVSILDNGCWEWEGCITRYGYGAFKDGVSWQAHRWAYVFCRGNIPKTLVCDHLCRNKRCVNPAHIELVTQRINTLRGNTLPAANHFKTHCIRGHPFLGNNLLFDLDGYRVCRACRKMWARLRRQRNKQQKDQTMNDKAAVLATVSSPKPPVRVLQEVARKAETMFRNFAGEDPGGCLTAGSPHAEACEIADELRDANNAIDNWRTFLDNCARPGDVANVIMERDRLLEENKNLRSQVQSLLDVPEAEAVKAQACRIRDLVSENVKLQRQVDALQDEKVRELWGVLNSVRVALRFRHISRESQMREFENMLPRMDAVLSALQEKE